MDPIQVMFKNLSQVELPDPPVALLVSSEFSNIVVVRPMSYNPLAKSGVARLINSYQDLKDSITEQGELIIVGHPSQLVKTYMYAKKDDLDPVIDNIINTLFYDS